MCVEWLQDYLFQIPSMITLSVQKCASETLPDEIESDHKVRWCDTVWFLGFLYVLYCVFVLYHILSCIVLMSHDELYTVAIL